MDFNKLSLEMHEENKGKLEVVSKVRVETKDDLSTAYTPGVAEPCRKINENPMDAYKYTCKANTIAVVSDGTAVLGLGDIGPLAAIPVMEGKSILFKRFGNVDAFPICLDTKDTEEIIETVKRIAPSFGGINLEDISAPRCFEIEERLKKELDIPVFHDDQHGTAIVVCAGIMNALKLIGKKMEDVTAVVNGAGAAGISITKLLLSFGLKDAILVDRQGAIYEGREGLNPAKVEIAKITNKNKEAGSLADVVKGKDIFLGVSAPGVLTKEMVSTMAKDSIIFAMANPTPEIMPDEAKAGGAAVVATGRSDFPNQINNVLVFPGIFRGALDARATGITEEMKKAAAVAIASIVKDDELTADYIIPDAFNPEVAKVVAKAVADEAVKLGITK
ncbi:MULTISPECIES: NAD(P)-dependent malic enzyme [Eubacterium]|uniref:Malate dehydrogenase (Oxaloacetate-decarboxylating) n=1 Tax=Eubacterium ruminantium TaxID=42322 RepID=A0A1T4NHD5_9FIRM|nr:MULTISPECIES: malic enzyme-like NAD(P)-binding protein [Eubacterium]MCR5368902.1 NAD-dependent malic enzyme [Eubacterium sp.]SCW53472.1 malate dehydrogenase (oxaloacetate-decarboxylating) [Eubacterium ruminantium]SDM87008.1 malate dehydrogenase (oxaloacetate-decarboxylating) [Eubacterium ruminantium]SJZ78168.1 malate dehydrogenase (oxaloacetate-decarboxylating) [Eubacterium ruminantium]